MQASNDRALPENCNDTEKQNNTILTRGTILHSRQAHGKTGDDTRALVFNKVVVMVLMRTLIQAR